MPEVWMIFIRVCSCYLLLFSCVRRRTCSSSPILDWHNDWGVINFYLNLFFCGPCSFGCTRVRSNLLVTFTIVFGVRLVLTGMPPSLHFWPLKYDTTKTADALRRGFQSANPILDWNNDWDAFNLGRCLTWWRVFGRCCVWKMCLEDMCKHSVLLWSLTRLKTIYLK